MADKFILDDEKIKTSSEIPESQYEELINKGVSCSDCKKELSADEIVMHRHIGITKEKEMSCQSCWCHAAYGDM